MKKFPRLNEEKARLCKIRALGDVAKSPYSKQVPSFIHSLIRCLQRDFVVHGKVMVNAPSQSSGYYPPGVEPRERRPRIKKDQAAFALLGAAIGGILARHPGGAVAGGAIGAVVAPGEPYPLETALRKMFSNTDYGFVSFTRKGPYHAVVVVNRDNEFNQVDSIAPPSASWTQKSLDDWLYGDLKARLGL